MYLSHGVVLDYDPAEQEEGEIVEKHGDIVPEESTPDLDDDDKTEEHVPQRGECRGCHGLPEEEHCIRTVDVRAHPIGRTLHGCVMTLAEESDRLPPRVSVLLSIPISTPSHLVTAHLWGQPA